MNILLLELVGRDVAVVSEDGTNLTRDLGVLEAFDGTFLRLRKANEERCYFPIANVQKIIADEFAFETIDADFAGQEEIKVYPGNLLSELENRSVSVWVNHSTARTDAVLEAFDEKTLRLNTGAQFIYFPLHIVRLIKPTG